MRLPTHSLLLSLQVTRRSLQVTPPKQGPLPRTKTAVLPCACRQLHTLFPAPTTFLKELNFLRRVPFMPATTLQLGLVTLISLPTLFGRSVFTLIMVRLRLGCR